MQNSSNGPLTERVIIITGASSGVGYATTRRLVQSEGATVVAVARRRVFRIEALAKQVGEHRLIAVTADMSEPGQADALTKTVMDRWGRIDGFIHAVNRVLRLTALDVSGPEFDLTMQVNVKSALYTVQAVAPIFRRRQQGSIVIYNPTPVQTEAFVASEAVYSAAANALSALAAGWTRQLEAFGISVREVAPSPETEGGLESRPTHDVLLTEALNAQLPRPRIDEKPPYMPSLPTVISSRGGLALTQF